MKFWTRTGFHPFLLSIHPLLSLAVLNFGVVIWNELFRLSVLILAVTSLLLLLLRRILHSYQRAALIVSLSSGVFFYFGHVLHWAVLSGVALRLDWLTAAWVAVWIFGIWWLANTRRSLNAMTVFLNISTIIMATSSLFQLAWLEFGSASVDQDELQRFLTLPALTSQAESAPKSGAPPDIYYIILDSYTRQDVLEEVFNYDNSAFIRHLENRGFFIGADSHSNYGQTLFSLTSSLNFNYLDKIENPETPKQMGYHFMDDLLVNNRVMRFLEQQGYQTVAFQSGYDLTEFTNADQYVTVSPRLSNLATSMIDSSFLTLFAQDWLLDLKRQRWVFSFDQLQRVVGEPSPKFVFVHNLAMHEPNLVDGQGCFVDPKVPMVVGYRNQIAYINQRVEETVDYILTHSSHDPVIIIQGDHGSEIYLDYQSGEHTCFHERFSILNAIHLPDNPKIELYDSISPVNTFRVVFDAYLGTDLGRLPDISYFSTYLRPFDFKVTPDLSQHCP